MNPFNSKRYMAEFIPAMGLYMAAILGRGFADLDAMAPALKYPLLFAPVLASIIVTIVILRAVFTMDEVQRRIITEACLVSMVIVGMGSFSYALVNGDLGLPDLSLIWVWPALIAVAGIAQCVLTLRMR
ncbi:hypothetical protein HK107_06045 [Parvularcula sp. ZS-1/3]|uniref:Uncharacterized protein n=1 Tax=Parvularcula mediterranea TaxID=2732508 RepID=A0A7Y3RMB1_9PROT|nr:hypothetical protein [Parvularcula mediterranea]NNU15882.1 hypothetical protein [Parvularcula mediterranea]